MIPLSRMQESTNTASMSLLLEERILAGSDWRLVEARRRYVRLEPPTDYWAAYRVRVAPRGDAAGDARELRLCVHGVFHPDAWSAYREAVLGPWLGRPCDPLDGLGYPVAFEEEQFAVWFYPFDPQLENLHVAADPAAVRRFLRRSRRSLFGAGADVGTVEVHLMRLLPEISAVLRYTVDVDGADRVLFAKAQRSGETAARVARELWDAAEGSHGLLRVPRPHGFHPELGALLEEAAPGDTVSSDRTSPVFLECADAAAAALAVIHDSNIPASAEMALEDEITRLTEVQEQMSYVHPRAYELLRELLAQLRGRLARVDEEEWLPTHGDLKYDQMVRDADGSFALTDFEYFGLAETSWDLAKFCAHAVPSMPETWEDSEAAERARARLLARYLELRPDATLQRFPLHEAVHLALRAMVLMWGQRSGWKDAAESLLVLAMDRLTTPPPA